MPAGCLRKGSREGSECSGGKGGPQGTGKEGLGLAVRNGPLQPGRHVGLERWLRQDSPWQQQMAPPTQLKPPGEKFVGALPPPSQLSVSRCADSWECGGLGEFRELETCPRGASLLLAAL